MGVVVTAPDGHLASGPYCCVPSPRFRSFGDTRGRPTVGCRIVSAAGVQVALVVVEATPDDHLTSGPNCGVTLARVGHIHNAGGGPSVIAAVSRNREFR